MHMKDQRPPYFGALTPQRVSKQSRSARPLAHARCGGGLLGGLAGGSNFKLIDDALDAFRFPGYALGLSPLFGGVHRAAQSDDVVYHIYIDLTPWRIGVAYELGDEFRVNPGVIQRIA